MKGAGGRRVAITGYGVVAPCGVGKEAFWQGLLGPGTSGGTSTRLPDWDPSPWFESPKEARRGGRGPRAGRQPERRSRAYRGRRRHGRRWPPHAGGASRRPDGEGGAAGV